jgi:hypothetical protein
MSSEEMRTELEIFVNRGLQEGWHGWPLKSEIDEGRSHVAPPRFWRGGRSSPALSTSRLGLFAMSASLRRN